MYNLNFKYITIGDVYSYLSVDEIISIILKLEAQQAEPVLFTFHSVLRKKLYRTFQRYIQPSFGSFGQPVSEKKIFQKSTNQKHEFPVAAMFVNGLGRKKKQVIYIEDIPQLLPTKFRFFWPSGFRGEDFFQESTNQK